MYTYRTIKYLHFNLKYCSRHCFDLHHIFVIIFLVPIEQVAIPVGGKAYLPCDTRAPNLNLKESTVDSSNLFMVMWFKEQNQNYQESQNYEQSAAPSFSSSPNSGEPIFT